MMVCGVVVKVCFDDCVVEFVCVFEVVFDVFVFVMVCEGGDVLGVCVVCVIVVCVCG